MDALVSVVKQQLDATNDQPLRSLQLQNHLYGCFLVMEDIGDRLLHLTEDHRLIGEHLSIDLTKHFSKIGLRYGFAMDPRIQLDPVDTAYRDAWIAWFHVIDETHDSQKVDATEDSINRLLQASLPSDLAFFIHASETGTLSQEWITKLLKLVDEDEDEDQEDTDVDESAVLAHAKVESPIVRPVVATPRRLARTRRHASSVSVATVSLAKKGLAKTRRRV